MKYTYKRAFDQHLDGAGPDNFADVYLIASKDEFDREESYKKLVKLLAGNERQNLVVKNFDASKLVIKEIVEEINSPSLFFGKAIVVIKNGEKLNKAAARSITSCLDNLTAYLVIVADSIDMRTSLYRSIEKRGVIYAPPEEKLWEKEKRMVSWVVGVLNENDKKISSLVAKEIINYSGVEAAILRHELEKLICYVGERKEITRNDVLKISTKVNEQTVWELGEAILQIKPDLAVQIGNNLLNDGIDIIALIAQIRSQMRNSCKINDVMSRGGAPSDVSRLFPYMRGKILDKNIKMALHYGRGRLYNSIKELNALELRAKSQVIDPALSLNLLIAKLCM